MTESRDRMRFPRVDGERGVMARQSKLFGTTGPCVLVEAS